MSRGLGDVYKRQLLVSARTGDVVLPSLARIPIPLRVVLPTGEPPYARIETSPPGYQKAGEFVRFDGRGSSDPDSPITCFQWLIESTSGTTELVQGVASLARSFDRAQRLSVQLRTSDRPEAAAACVPGAPAVPQDLFSPFVDMVLYTIVNATPTAVPVTSPAEFQRIREGVLFSALSSEDPDGTIVSYEWKIFSSNPDPGIPNPLVLTDPVFVRSFAQPQDLEISLSVTDDAHSSDVATARLQIVDNMPPRANAGPDTFGTASNSSGSYICVTELSGCGSADPDGRIAAFEWYWGDGAIDRVVINQCLAVHTYRAPGTYVASLVVYDDGDGTCPPMTSTGPNTCPSRRLSAPDTVEVTCLPLP